MYLFFHIKGSRSREKTKMKVKKVAITATPVYVRKDKDEWMRDENKQMGSRYRQVKG